MDVLLVEPYTPTTPMILCVCAASVSEKTPAPSPSSLCPGVHVRTAVQGKWNYSIADGCPLVEVAGTGPATGLTTSVCNVRGGHCVCRWHSP